MITNFPRINGEHNTAGHSAIYFLQKSKVTNIPLAINKAITELITAVDSFKKAYCVANEIRVTDDPTLTNAGIKWPVSVKGRVPVDKPEFVSLFEKMVNVELIVLVMDNNKRLKVFGTNEKGLRFLYKTVNGGYEYEFRGDFSEAPSFYYNNIAIDSGVVSGGSYTPPTMLIPSYEIGGLIPQQVLYGAADGKIKQDAVYKWDDGDKKLYIGSKLFLNTTRIGYLPDQVTFPNSLFWGNGGGSLNKTAANEGSSNSGFGVDALGAVTKGFVNSAFGSKSLRLLTDGLGNSAFGNQSLEMLTGGFYNVAMGHQALTGSTGASFNTGIGTQALLLNNANNNVGVGYRAAYSNVSGIRIVAIGSLALFANTGNNVVAIGYQAGGVKVGGDSVVIVGDVGAYYLLNGVTSATSFSNSTYIGRGTRVSANAVVNENVFGYAASGAGSNTVVIGNDAIVNTLLKGKVGINFLNDASVPSMPTSFLDIKAAFGYQQLRLRTPYTPTGTAGVNGATGDVCWDDNYFYIKTSVGWKRTALSTF